MTATLHDRVCEMTQDETRHAVDLAEEAERYLRAVDAFRAAGRVPEWRPEQVIEPADQPAEGPDRLANRSLDDVAG